ncbi:MAG TPA: ABC transporter ATP-binding protein/permease [Candidatus Fusicatenibacter merdavium]|uniref:ABC transporter ATP-binding protein/permease n=1 Tax=Candidatus Fusicatenibacter merdavium TaxID=2838600 RepID=A0A9D1XHV1_9FIRM|nr:ABC transporter ATP-binding protein/permease [Candidatus Fusicatenibacter merdavium]
MKQSKRGSLSRILDYTGSYKVLTIFGCVLSGIAAVLGLVPYVCVWLVAREVLVVFPDVRAASGLEKWGWIAVAFAVANILFYFAALMCTHIAAFRTARNIRMAAMTHVLKLPMGFFTGNQSGRLRKLIDDNAGLTEDLLAHKLPDLTATFLTPVAGVIMLFLFDWRMGLLCLLTMILALACMMAMMGGKNAGFFHRYQKEIEKMSGEAVEYVRGIPVVKMFQQTVYSFKAFYNAIHSYSELASQYAMSCRNGQTGFLTCINGAFALLIPAALLLASGGDVRQTAVNFIFYILFAPACGAMINRIMYMSEAVMEADEAILRLDEIMAEKPLEEGKNAGWPENSGKGLYPAAGTAGDSQVEFSHVTFTYPGGVRPALEDVSFTVRPGSVVALVGPSGGGKTTAASLIPRFWDVDSGSVTVGGVDVRKLDSRTLMSRVAFVFQDTRLFKQSLLENIRAARPEATREQVLEAARAAQCGDILEKLPDGLDTVIGTKGVYLSGGECQRIALARAILKDAPIVALDEATAFADPENEHQIQKAFETLTRGKTVLMIAHRLSTIRNADQIIVLKEGKIAEQGTHRQLLETGGIYAEMWADYQRSAQWKVGKEVLS